MKNNSNKTNEVMFIYLKIKETLEIHNEANLFKHIFIDKKYINEYIAYDLYHITNLYRYRKMFSKSLEILEKNIDEIIVYIIKFVESQGK